ncbi:hypothetical protein KW460_15065, partial [Vibrio fluvialis]|nr:hypothetical protein [Vibrio fluvialis]
MNIKQLTQLSHRVAVVMLLDKGVPYSGWLAKYAAVDSIGHCINFTKILICTGTNDEASKTYIYSGRKRS